jgi:hypothetical protein
MIYYNTTHFNHRWKLLTVKSKQTPRTLWKSPWRRPMKSGRNMSENQPTNKQNTATSWYWFFVTVIKFHRKFAPLRWVHTRNVTAYRNTLTWQCGRDSWPRNVSKVGYAVMLTGLFDELLVFGRRIKRMIRLRPEQVRTCNVTRHQRPLFSLFL